MNWTNGFLRPFPLLALMTALLTGSQRVWADRAAWSITPGPNNAGSSSLYGVAAVSPTDVWAVGGFNSSALTSALIEHWDGTGWSIVASPNLGVTGALYAVTAISANDVWAVGYKNRPTGSDTLTEHWNGTSWSVIPSPDASTEVNNLNAVAAVSSTNVWAVGWYRNPDAATGHSLAEHWNGTEWSLVPVPYVINGETNGGLGTSNNLSGVTAISSTDVWAVGFYTSASQGEKAKTLAEHWDGTSWSVVPSPTIGDGQTSLLGVMAISSKDVWAVGFDRPSSFQTLTEHWDGTSWSAVPSPNIGTDDTFLWAVTRIPGTRDAWSVGSYTSSTGSGFVQRTLTERLHGHQWRVVSSPNASDLTTNTLRAVTALSPTAAWAVGSYLNADNTPNSLIESYS